jgi:hypothetical protein
VPDAQIRWRDVWIGAAVTAVLFTVGDFLIGMYLGRAGVGSAYGAAEVQNRQPRLPPDVGKELLEPAALASGDRFLVAGF